jgi:galactose mutarotase-like enzyme
MGITLAYGGRLIMYTVHEFKDNQYTIYELKDGGTDSWVKVAPERGGIIYSYGVRGKELLYLNSETFYNQDQNVRGGIPILFPISGQLANGSYEWQGTTYKMKNHGVARTSSWEVVGTNESDGASITLQLTSSAETRAAYPFDFKVVFTYVLKEGKLSILQEYINLSDEDMPIYAGFHPYFKTSNKNITYDTNATRYYDYNDDQTKEIKGSIDLTHLKESAVLLDATDNQIGFEVNAGKVALEYGPEFKYIVLWTEEDKEFVCVEPWMAKTGELNKKEELVMIPPKESVKTFLTISGV